MSQHEEYGVEIYDPDNDRLVVDNGGPVPMSKDEAFYELRRWKGYGYDTRRVMRRTVTVTEGEWEEVTCPPSDPS